VYAGIGGGIMTVGLLALMLATRNHHQTVRPPLTVEDLEQQKYDAQQKENQKNKAAQLRNDLFLRQHGCAVESPHEPAPEDRLVGAFAER
jgi:hypothetical protein